MPLITHTSTVGHALHCRLSLKSPGDLLNGVRQDQAGLVCRTCRVMVRVAESQIKHSFIRQPDGFETLVGNGRQGLHETAA